MLSVRPAESGEFATIPYNGCITPIFMAICQHPIPLSRGRQISQRSLFSGNVAFILWQVWLETAIIASIAPYFPTLSLDKDQLALMISTIVKSSRRTPAMFISYLLRKQLSARTD